MVVLEPIKCLVYYELYLRSLINILIFEPIIERGVFQLYNILRTVW